MTPARPVLCLASANPGKVAELRQLLGDRYEIRARPDDLPDTIEDGATLAENALKKAAEVAAHCAALAVADDSGLFVDALDGRPGVWTARYAGPEADPARNVAKLLAELAAVTDRADRSARFRAVLAAVWPDGRQLTVDGVVEGWIATEPRGEGGFGYDPVFVPAEGDGSTFAEMDPAAKHAISHRGRAVAALRDALP